jgi:hypothetical protein
MKHEFSNATLAKAALVARKHGHATVAALIDGRSPEPREELLAAAKRGDEQTVRRLLGLDLTIGERMPDGTVYAGISPDSGKRLFAASSDAPTTMKFNSAAAYAKNLEQHGHKDWRLPTRNELRTLFDNRAAIGGFASAPGSGDAHWYWSSTERLEDQSTVWAVGFTFGGVVWGHKDNDSLSARVVRVEP